jgi:hypothetical protein
LLHYVERNVKTAFVLTGGHSWSREQSDRGELERTHADIDPRFLFINVGFNMRPMEIQGAMGTLVTCSFRSVCVVVCSRKEQDWYSWRKSML